MASDELNLQKLSDYIQTCWIDNRVEYLKNDPVDILQIIFRHGGCEDLRKFCLNSICENPKILFESPKFTSLETDLIILFLKNNELEMEEIEIWEFVLKWALARMSTQYNVDNLSQWTSNIIGYHFDPDTPPVNAVLPLRRNLSYIDSVLIERDHLSIIASWIDKKEKSFYDTKSTPYLFKLLYRASRDGFEAAKFHELCDNKGSTIMISKLKENGRLIGGYNPLSWQRYSTIVQNNGTWQSTLDSFLFSFIKKEEINSAFITRVKSNKNSASVTLLRYVVIIHIQYAIYAKFQMTYF
ncbi:BTB/POZ protein [Rhizophagus irregularis DAOM 181602=DAOM 197198]|nr:BTB/POZ protein [Rhizophagus irregularis DAOM 181602=DAOM 197198]